METLIHLLSVFSQLSILGFGGGKGIIPQMHTDAVTTYRWVTSEQFTQFYTIGKLVPGPDDDLRRAHRLRGAAATSVVGGGGCDGGHVRTVEPHHDRLRFAGSTFCSLTLARDHLAWACAGNRRPRLVERLDDRSRGAVVGCGLRDQRRGRGLDASHQNQRTVADPALRRSGDRGPSLIVPRRRAFFLHLGFRCRKISLERGIAHHCKHRERSGGPAGGDIAGIVKPQNDPILGERTCLSEDLLPFAGHELR